MGRLFSQLLIDVSDFVHSWGDGWIVDWKEEGIFQSGYFLSWVLRKEGLSKDRCSILASEGTLELKRKAGSLVTLGAVLFCFPVAMRKGLFGLHFRLQSVIRRSQSKNSRQEPGADETLLASFLSCSLELSFMQPSLPARACYRPQWAGPFHFHHQSRQFPADLPTVKSDGGIYQVKLTILLIKPTIPYGPSIQSHMKTCHDLLLEKKALPERFKSKRSGHF